MQSLVQIDHRIEVVNVSEVSIVRGQPPYDENKIYDLTKNCIDLLGGINKFVRPGERILIKPNFVRPGPPPVTTDPRVVRAMAKLVAEAGAKPVIGEGTATMTLLWREGMDSRRVLELAGMDKVVAEIGGELAPFDEKGTSFCTETTIPGAIVLRKAKIADAALSCDGIIPIPVMKCSMEGGGVTLTIKCLHALTEPYTDRLKFHRSDLWQKLVDILKLVRPKIRLSVIDGLLAMEGDGPIYGDPVEMNVLIAGNDPVSVDAVGAMVVGIHDPFEVGPIAIAHSEGLGVADPNLIKMLGERLESVHRHLRRASCEILANIFPNVSLLEGGTCRTCKAWIKFMLYALKGERILQDVVPKSVGKLLFITGLDPSLPEEGSEVLKLGLPVVFGDCALFSTSHRLFWQLREKALYIPGCPPFAVKQNTQLVKRALGLQITGKEAYGFRPTYQ
mgnify:CR=1 FL=1